MNSLISHERNEASHYITMASAETAAPLTQLSLDRLTSDQQRALEQDLVLASQVQRGLLPRTNFRFGQWSIHYQYRSEGIVGGDYCDVIPAAAQNAGPTFLLGDVSGKGVAASLLMTHLHATFRSLACTGLELGDLLTTANRVFCDSTPATQYATLVCGRLTPGGELELASAGHLPGLLLSQSGVAQIFATGFPLGLFPATQYAVHKFHLQPGDSLMLYTDGISEARDRSGNEFGIEGLVSAVSGLHGHSAEALVSACDDTVNRFSSGQRPSDDQTLMAISFKGVC